MTKTELIQAIADQTGDSKAAAGRALDAIIMVAKQRLADGEDMHLPGFGRWSTVDRAARDYRNPRTGAPVKVKAGRRVRFAAGKALRDAVAA